MKLKQIDLFFRAFGDETRLRILNLLIQRKELCVCELIEVLKIGQSKISRHLAYLKNAGLILDRKAGLWNYYLLKKPNDSSHKKLLDCLRQFIEDVPALKKDAAALKKYSKNPAKCR